MCVPAENAVSLAQARMGNRAGGYFGGKAQPAGIQAIEKAGETLALEIDFLQLKIEERAQAAEKKIVDDEAVELMSVDCQVPEASKIPLVFLIDLHSYQVRHDVAQAVVVIAFHPHHLHSAFRIGKFADVAQKLPVRFCQAAKIKIGEDVAQQDQSMETVGAEHSQRLFRAADLRAEMQVREDERVIDEATHHFSCSAAMLKEDENCTKNSAQQYPGKCVAAYLLLCGGHVLLGKSGPFAEEVLLHLLNDNFLVFAACGVQSIFV